MGEFSVEGLEGVMLPGKYPVGLYTTEEEQKELDRRGVAAIGLETDDRVRLSGPFIIQSREALTEDFLRKVYCRYHNLPLEILRTRRTIVREMDPEKDIDGLFALYRGEGMTDYVENLYSYEEELAYEKDYVKNIYGIYDFGMWNVFDREEGRLIGRAGLEERALAVDIPLEEDSWLELGYMIDTRLQGKGLGYEVCRGILSYARDQDRHHFYCRIHPGNLSSVSLARKLGFCVYCSNDSEGEDLWILKD